MAFDIKEPTEEELDTYPGYTLASPEEWEPYKFWEDKDTINPAVSNYVLAAQLAAFLKDQEEVPDIPIVPDDTSEAPEESSKTEISKKNIPDNKILKPLYQKQSRNLIRYFNRSR